VYTGVFRTDQTQCYNRSGELIPCLDTGQDGGVRAGIAWPEPRFFSDEDTVVDNLTGLMWTRNANLPEFPLMWEEAFAYVKQMNGEARFGYKDWRLPNRKELFSLISHVSVNPCLPANHPFVNVFTGYYWSSTTCARLPSQAWYVHVGGGRVFKGMKHGSYVVWPVRTNRRGVVDSPRFGQERCYDESGKPVACEDTGYDGALAERPAWRGLRFFLNRDTVIDNLTNLIWTRNASCTGEAVNWQLALNAVKKMNVAGTYGYQDWRLPNIRELESLADMGSHTPALSAGHPFDRVQAWYWSSTTSTYDPRYAWVLYTVDGAVGVGHKPRSDFFVWAVRAGQIEGEVRTSISI
jgi:hypothetical protein